MAGFKVLRDLKVIERKVRSGVELRLSNEEAIALKAVLGSVSGNPTTSLRGFTSSVYNALEDAGVFDVNLADVSGFVNCKPGSLYRVRGFAQKMEDK